MKNKLYLIFALFISVLMINTVNAESIITYDKTYEYGNQIDYFENMITINNKLYILTTSSKASSSRKIFIKLFALSLIV